MENIAAPTMERLAEPIAPPNTSLTQETSTENDPLQTDVHANEAPRVEASTERKTLVIMDEQDSVTGDTPLHLAVKMALGTVLSEEPLVEEVDPKGQSRLDECLRHGSTRDVQGFSVSQLACAQRLHNKDGLMPLHIAAARGNAAVCEALLNAGAPINARSLRRKPLVNAHFCQPPQWIKRSTDGKVTEVAVAHKTALHFAVGLIRDKQELDEAPEEPDLTLVRLLLRFGADVNVFDFHGQTPFHIAIICGLHELVALLATARADLTTSCRSFGRKNTALHLATLRGDVRMVTLLTGHGAAVDAIGRDGWTPLCLAARQGSLEVAKALIDARADVFAPSDNGKAPLEIAALNSKHQASAVLELIRHEVATKVLDIAYSRVVESPLPVDA
jgi:ankyrin repeat protein